jgi:hypothetical protein
VSVRRVAHPFDSVIEYELAQTAAFILLTRVPGAPRLAFFETWAFYLYSAVEGPCVCSALNKQAQVSKSRKRLGGIASLPRTFKPQGCPVQVPLDRGSPPAERTRLPHPNVETHDVRMAHPPQFWFEWECSDLPKSVIPTGGEGPCVVTSPGGEGRWRSIRNGRHETMKERRQDSVRL